MTDQRQAILIQKAEWKRKLAGLYGNKIIAKSYNANKNS